jgi:hypothetical protein
MWGAADSCVRSRCSDGGARRHDGSVACARPAIPAKVDFVPIMAHGGGACAGAAAARGGSGSRALRSSLPGPSCACRESKKPSESLPDAVEGLRALVLKQMAERDAPWRRTIEFVTCC